MRNTDTAEVGKYEWRGKSLPSLNLSKLVMVKRLINRDSSYSIVTKLPSAVLARRWLVRIQPQTAGFLTNSGSQQGTAGGAHCSNGCGTENKDWWCTLL